MKTAPIVPPASSNARDLLTAADVTAGASRWGAPEWFIVAQTVLPALLYLPGTQKLRVPIRVAPFALSLAGLAWLLLRRPAGERKAHPAAPWLIAVTVLVALMILHPTTNSPLVGIAQTTVYVAVLAPALWVPELVSTPAQVGRILAILLVVSGVNSVVGILQVYDPDRWLPREFSDLVMHSYSGVLSYVGPTGERIVRPPGLSDNPGAVCGPGMISAFLGLFFFTRRVAWPFRCGALALSFAGATVIYLSHVRTSILIGGGMCVAYAAAVWLQGRRAHAAAFAGATAALIAGAFVAAVTMGGHRVAERFATLTEDNVYYDSGRGGELEVDFTGYLARYPLGAGLGRWGMMRDYFGDPSNPDSPQLWAELQLPAWVLDGGVLLLVLYSAALLRTAVYELSLSRDRRPEVSAAAAVVFAINAGTLAIIFGYTPFSNQLGLQYWFLTGALSGLAHESRGSACAPTS
jgi:hypothetical protein